MSSVDNVEASDFKDNISDHLHKYIRPEDTLVRYLFVMEIEELTGELATALVALKECRTEKHWKLRHFYAQDWMWSDVLKYFPALINAMRFFFDDKSISNIIKKSCITAYDMEEHRRIEEEKLKKRGTIDNVRSGLTFLKDLDGRAWNSGEKSGFQARIDTSQHLLRILSPQRLKRCIGKDLNYDMDKYMKALSSVADEIRLGLRNTDASFDGVGRLANFMTLFVAQDAKKLDTFLLFKLDWREVGKLSFMDFLPSTRGRFNPSVMLGSTLAARQDMERALRYYADALMVIFGGADRITSR